MTGHVLSLIIAPSHVDLGPSNTCFLGPTRVHNANGISIGSAVNVRLVSGMWEHALPTQNYPFAWGFCTPSVNTWFLGSPGLSIPNDIYICSAVFAELTAERPYTLQWAALSPQNCPFLSVI